MTYSAEQILNDTENKAGLFHYNCHCKEVSIPTPQEPDIKLIYEQGKIDWLYKDKSEWIHSFGYEDVNEFLEYLKNKIVESYCLGRYVILQISKYGVAINIFVDVEGSGEKYGKIYRLKSGWMVFSNGKIKCNTFLGGWVE